MAAGRCKPSHAFDGVKMALRLSEPEENEENWLLETILMSATSINTGHLLSAKRKLPIADAIPKKWALLPRRVEQAQKQIVDLIQLDA